MSAAPGPIQRAAYRVWLAVGAVALIWIAWRLLARPLAVIVPPLVLATVIVYLLAPIVAALERRGLPRWAGALLAYLSGVVVVVGLGAILVPLLTDQLQAFAERLPDLLADLGQDLNRRLAPLGIDVPLGDSNTGTALQSNIEQAVQGGALPSVAGVLGGLSGLALGLLQNLIVFVLGPVIAFYALVALPGLRDWAHRLIPPQHRAEAIEVGSQLHLVVGGFIRGQLLVALFVGIVTSGALAALGLPFWLLVGVTAGLTNVVPLLGPFVAGALGVSIALVSEGVGLAALVLLVMIAVQQLDNHLISPLVMGRNVHVHPLVVLLALVIAGTVYGVVGLLIAVPAVAAGSVLVRHFWETRVPWANTPIAPQAQTGAQTPDQTQSGAPLGDEAGVAPSGGHASGVAPSGGDEAAVAPGAADPAASSARAQEAEPVGDRVPAEPHST
jgi:predicted PurR-regulated permease PerM